MTAAVTLLLATLLDPKATVAQRNDACFSLRGNRSAEVTAALSDALRDKDVRACAARDLREAGAVETLVAALTDTGAETRIAAAHELGEMRDPKAIDALGAAALDENPLVSAAAIGALGAYEDKAAFPLLLRAGALQQAARFHDPAVLPLARRVLASGDAASQMIALSVLMDLGGKSDLPKLKEIAAKSEKLESRGRGFGFMPAIDLARAAQNAIERISASGR
jgi:HEAT repeat protein